MADHCCTPSPVNLDRHRANPAYRRALWAVLAINGAMFLVEIGAGLAAGSASLQADALDFLGDAANYAISLFVVGMALRYRATAAMIKGLTMGAFGLWIIGTVIWHALHGTLPSAVAMGAVGVTALIANGVSFALLWAHRQGDANMRSAWICTRNDVLDRKFGGAPCCSGRISAQAPDGLTSSSRPSWPSLALQGSATVARHALAELRHDSPLTA